MLLRNVLIISTLLLSAESLKILVLYLTPSFSHQRPILALSETLVEKGHQLFVVSPNSVPGLLSHENYTYVDVSFVYKFVKDEKGGTIKLNQRYSKWNLWMTFEPMAEVVKQQLSSEPFMQLKRRVEADRIKFDLIITESFYIPFACGFSRAFPGSPRIISMSSLPFDQNSEESLGSILHPSFTPFLFGEYTFEMSLWQKIDNWVSGYYIRHQFFNIMDVAASEYFKETYGAESERLLDSYSTSASLSLISSSFLYFYPRLLGPNVIEVGPLHLKTPKTLPKHLQDWLDGAEKGVIYFSLGSNMQSSALPEDVRANFLKFFRQLSPGYRVLWKWELDGAIPGQSPNILGQKWLPQDSVLAHPKVRVFISQGGLQSFQETVHYGVPVVGIPWFGDQECNVARIVDAGIGVQLLPMELTSYEKVRSAVEAVLFDERYSKNMKKLSAISHDFTAQASDKAIFWVEHVAKFGGAHLRPSTADTTLFEYFCLDILTVILVLGIVILYAVKTLVKYLMHVAFSSKIIKIKKS